MGLVSAENPTWVNQGVTTLGFCGGAILQVDKNTKDQPWELV